MPKELLTAVELAARLRVRPDTIRDWSRRGLIPTYRISPKVIRYDLAAVIESLGEPQNGSEVPRG